MTVTSVDRDVQRRTLTIAARYGAPDGSMPTTHTRVTLAGTADGGTDMTVMSVFPSVAAMEKMVAMGVVEGITAALGQVDDLLSADVSG